MTKDNITLETTVEELVERYPEAVGFLARNNVRCIRFGEALCYTLKELFREEGIRNPHHLIDELKRFLKIRRPIRS
ncbi:MAG: hypothetical protein GTO17_11390 [Candidatus Aminicenantes bacterium]|nr:hypothetical protein [Candidatus Aminicenantes bacterium]